MLTDYFGDNSYAALFLVSFLASTILPLGSEWLLVTLILNGNDPALSVIVATAGNYCGACTTYWIGIYGSSFLITRLLRIDENARKRAERFYAKYGSWSLFFSWVPIVGDPLCLVGGLLEVGFIRFSLLVSSGKLVRYVVVAFLTLAGKQLSGVA
jgi:membrane protein YqaA with SNARE-associated domain